MLCLLLLCLASDNVFACFQLPYTYNGHEYSDAIEDTYTRSNDGHSIHATYYYNPNPDMIFYFGGAYGGVLIVYTASSFLIYYQDLTDNSELIDEYWSDNNNNGYGFNFGVNNDYWQPSPMDTSQLYTSQNIVIGDFNFPANCPKEAIHLPVKPVPSVGVGDPALDYGVHVSWARFPHNGIDYSSNLSDEVKSVGTGIVHRFTEPNASRFGSIDPDGRGPAIWVRYKLSTGEPIYVLYGHTATSWNDLSSWLKRKFNFNCSYSIKWKAGDKIATGEQVGLSAPFYHSGSHQEHLHLSVFKPKQKSDGTYYGPPSTGWGYSPLDLTTKNDLNKYGALGSYIDPDDFFTGYYLSDDIQ